MKKRPAAILFDLDGTLVDTAPDMVAALTALCFERNVPAVDYPIARSHVSDGSIGLIRLAFGSATSAIVLEELRSRFLQLYAENLCVHSHLFPGMPEVLDYLNKDQLPWGIVTNKPEALTQPLVKALMLSTRAKCVISGDTLPRKKPDPLPLVHASEMLGIAPDKIVYVGDSIRDIQAGNAAGMSTVSATYGYIVPGDNPEHWPTNLSIDHPLNLIELLEHRVQSHAI